MADGISKIQINKNYQLGSVGEKPEEKANQKNEKKQEVEKQPQVSAEDTLNFLDVQSLNARPIEKPRVLDISKYVTPEQAKRICGFISQFEDAVTEGLKNIETEFGSALSEEAKMDLAVEIFKAENM